MIVNVGGGGRGSSSKGVLYDAGDEKAAITGGWDIYAPIWPGQAYYIPEGSSSAVNAQNPVGATKNTNNFKIYFELPHTGNSANANAGFGTANTIDLSRYSTLHIQASTVIDEGIDGGNHYVKFGVADSKDPVYPSDYEGSLLHPPTPSGSFQTLLTGESTLDISNLSRGYICIIATNVRVAATQLTMKTNVIVTKVWLT